MERFLKIGDVCRLYGITPDTLRHYEAKGLIQPWRDPKSGYRYYSVPQLDVIDCILAGRAIGIPLSQIRRVIEAEDVAVYRAMYEAQTERLDEEIVRLQRLQQVTAARLEELSALETHLTAPVDGVTREDITLYLIDVATLFALESDAPDTEGMATLSTWRLFEITVTGAVENDEWVGFSFAPSAAPTELEQGFRELVTWRLAKEQHIPAGTPVHSFWGDDRALSAHLRTCAETGRCFVRVRYSLLHRSGEHEYFVDIFATE